MRCTTTHHQPHPGGLAMSILELFCSVDEFWQQFAPQWERELLASGQRRRQRATRRHPSEIMTIVIRFQQSGYRTFKAYYTQHVQVYFAPISPTRELQSLRRVAAARAGAARRLSAHPAGRLHRHQLRGLHGLGGLPQAAYPPAPRLSRWTPAVARPRSAGSTASSCIWWSTTGATCWPSA